MRIQGTYFFCKGSRSELVANWMRELESSVAHAIVEKLGVEVSIFLDADLLFLLGKCGQKEIRYCSAKVKELL